MHKEGVEGFPYFVGVNSLSELATREDKVCVLNILGKESTQVTPTSHCFSGGNIVFGTGPGKSGKVLETPIGDIPVFNSVKEGRAAGLCFNTAVIYLPPSGVKDGVAEVVRQNPDLKKVIVLTEKVSVKDSRIIRAICQTNGIDIFGANCLGIGDSWNKVRLGGALGGSKPDESLVKGSVAIFSNSGNFTTTIAVYLLSKGWGTTTSISSGKDVYINFGPKEFIHAFDNDDRSKVGVIYSEPGGYYEHGLESKKPLVACVVGRWKAKFTRACGHSGSLAGSGDDAIAKEKWFMDYFGVNSIFTPENPAVSKKGAVVNNISHIPDAVSAVMKANGTEPDFAPKGNLSLKSWMGNTNGLNLPKELDIETVEAVAPYNEQIEAINRIVGAQLPRQSMKDTSGASAMDRKTQITRIHNLSVLEASKSSLESNLVFCLLKEHPSEKGRTLANIALNSYLNMYNETAVLASDASRKNDNSPNTVLASAVAIIGKGAVKKSLEASRVLFNLFQTEREENPFTEIDFSNALDNASKSDAKDILLAADKDETAEETLNLIVKTGADSFIIKFLKSLTEKTEKNITGDTLLSAIWMTIGWGPLRRRKITTTTLLSLPWYSKIFSTMVGCSVDSKKHSADSFCGVPVKDLVSSWSFTETAFLSLVGSRPSKEELYEFTLLLGLIITNGPGTISAQGAKGAVSADGPEQPDRVQINKSFVGFLTHTGYAHGGNGFEAIAFLIEQFKNTSLKNPGDPKHGIDIRKLASDYAESYAEYKANQKSLGNRDYKKIPCVNHPVFKGKAINIDPREEYVSKLLKDENSYNIFLDFYHNLVQSLFDSGVSNNIYCVNVDAVIAVILLKIIWDKYKNGQLTDEEIESGAFTLFLFGRMIGCAAETDDHINRGKNMDTRTPASKCVFAG